MLSDIFKKKYKKMIDDNGLEIKFFHKEKACYSGRFSK